MNGLPPLSGAILISNPRDPHMALALENPKPGTLRRVAQFAQAHNLSIEKALDAAGFSANLPLAKRGAKSASAAFKKFFLVGQKGMKGKFGSKKFGAAGSRGGPVSKSAVRAAEHAYEARFGRVKRVSMVKARITDMSPADALRHRLRTKAKEAYRKAHGGKLGKGWGKSAVAKKISSASDSELRKMAQAAGVSGILKSQEKRKGTKAKLRAHAEKLRAEGKLWQTPQSGGKRGKSPARAAGTAGFKRGRGAGGRFVSAAQVAADHDWHAAYARDNRGRDRRGRFTSRRNGLALENGLALMNPLALQNALALENGAFDTLRSYTLGYVAPLALGATLGAGVLVGSTLLDVESKMVDVALKVPVVGEYAAQAIEMAPMTAQAVLVSAGLLAVSEFLVSPGSTREFLRAAAAASISAGVTLDVFHPLLDSARAKLASSDVASVEGTDLGALALENVSALGALALENVSALGDGMAWELGRLGASQGNLGAHDYAQANVADAYYAGHDFSEVEGSALINGRDAWLGTFGVPSTRKGGMAGQASHLAQQPGHQWGWLIQSVGYEGAAQICALRPQQRVAVIMALKQAAMKAYQDLMLQQQAMAVQGPQPELVPAAGTGAMGAVGASGPGMGASYLGDPNVFASASV